MDLGCVKGGLAQIGPKRGGHRMSRMASTPSREKLLLAMPLDASRSLKRLPSRSVLEHKGGVWCPTSATADAQACVLQASNLHSILGRHMCGFSSAGQGLYPQRPSVGTYIIDARPAPFMLEHAPRHGVYGFFFTVIFFGVNGLPEFAICMSMGPYVAFMCACVCARVRVCARVCVCARVVSFGLKSDGSS